MKRSSALLVALVVLTVWIAGCSRGPTPEQLQIKDAFIDQLIGFCAEVNRQLKKIEGGPTAQPGKVADQFELLAEQARRQHEPDLHRDQFKIMMTEIDATVVQFRLAQAAVTGDRSRADAALAQANRQLASADAAAQKYGMPPLGTCADHPSGTSSPTPDASSPTPDPSATPAPAAGWRPRQEMAVAVNQVLSLIHI